MRRSSSTPCAPRCRAPATACACCCTRSSASSATPQGRIARVTDARGASGRESIMRLELDRPLTADGGRGARGGGARGARRAPARRRRLRGDAGDMVERMAAAAHAAAGVRDADEVEETAAFLDWLRDGHFILLGARAYDIADGPAGPTVQVAAGLGPRHPARRRRVALRRADAARRAAGVPARAPRRERRPARDRQDQPPLAGAPARAHGRRLGARRCGPTARSRACCA